MNLLKPLELDGANTEGLSMVPTKEFFKAVLVIVAPLTRENGELLKCDYLFDRAGNPHEFEGVHKLAGELSGAEIILAGKVVAPRTLKTEKVAHFGAFRAEKKGMRLRIRVHLPELDQTELLELFRFLSTLNKEGYSVTIQDAQGSLIPKLSGVKGKDDPDFKFPEPGAGGEYSRDHLTRRPFEHKRPKLLGDVTTIEASEGQFLFGWSCEAQFKQAVFAAGKVPNVRDTVYETCTAAIAAGVVELWAFQKSIVCVSDGETKTLQALREYLLELAPQLEERFAADLDADRAKTAAK